MSTSPAEAREAPGPDRDGDADDIGVQPAAVSRPAPGMGTAVDKLA